MFREMIIAAIGVAMVSAGASAQEFTTNGGFESGDTSGWEFFPLGGITQTFEVTVDANSGSFAGELYNEVTGNPLVIKQANMGVGSINPGDAINISFAAKGSTTEGGVVFAEFFSELTGGGVSSQEFLGGGPLALTGTYQTFNFNTFAGFDVSGGVTLQFNAVSAANIGSTARLFLDDVSVTLVSPPLAGDVTGDGFVGIADLNVVLGNWNAGTPPVAPGPDVLSDFSSVTLDGTYVQFDTGTFTSGVNDFTIQANDFGGGFFDLAAPLDATGEGILELQLDVNAGNVADKMNIVLVDADGTERVFRFDGMVVGNDQTLEVDLANFLQDNLPGTTPGLDLSSLTTFHVQGTFENGDPGLALDLTLDNLALIPGIVPLGPADINGDGFVGIADLNIVLGNWNAGTPPAASAVPEPATMALLGLGGLTVLRRRS
jgi:hypothetical protein